MGDFHEMVLRRESCRNFSKTPVEKEKLTRMLESARLAPSACNAQPWHFTVVNGGEAAPKVAKCLQNMGINHFADNCPAFIIISEEGPNFSAAVGGLLLSRYFTPYDVGIAAAHLCFAAQCEGLSTCIIGCFDEKKLKALAQIPKNKKNRSCDCCGLRSGRATRAEKKKAARRSCDFPLKTVKHSPTGIFRPSCFVRHAVPPA